MKLFDLFHSPGAAGDEGKRAQDPVSAVGPFGRETGHQELPTHGVSDRRQDVQEGLRAPLSGWTPGGREQTRGL